MKYYSGLYTRNPDSDSEKVVRDMIGLIDNRNVTRILDKENLICYGSGESNLKLFSTSENDDYLIIFNGDLYYEQSQINPSRILLDRLKLDSLTSLAENTEGVFVLIVLDKKSRQLHFITDRMGLRLTYIYIEKDRIYWSSESKSFLSKCIGNPDVNEESIHEIIQNGHLSGTRSLLKNVQLLPAGSILTYYVDSKSVSVNKYWRWNPNDSHSNHFEQDLKNYTEYVFHQLKKSVRARMTPGHLKHAHFLSGGLDSRAILASMDSTDDVMTITFGASNSLDHIIAEKISKLANTTHHFIEINRHNWLEKRLKAVWWTDGQFNLLHMHGIEAFDILQQTDIIFSGAMEKFIRGHDISSFKHFEDLENRERRFIRNGSLMDDKVTLTRFPFYDYTLLDILEKIPTDIRNGDRFYHHLLTTCYPEFFNGIPDSNTNMIIKNNTNPARKLILKILKKTGFLNYTFHNYPDWIRHQKTLFKKVLDEKCQLNDFGYGDRVRKLTDNIDRLNNRECEVICMFITLELYLSCINKPYQADDFVDDLNRFSSKNKTGQHP